MGEEIITRVHVLAEKEGRSRVTNSFNFDWRPGTAMKEPLSEETIEDQLSIDEHKEESEDPDDEQTEEDGEPIKGGDPINEEEENEDQEPTGPAQSTDEASIRHEEAEREEPESNEEYSSGPDEENDDPNDVSLVLNSEGEAHNIGYNLRKRKPINYGETRNHKTTATILYQYGKVAEMSDKF